jgi:DNA (cytosine-5)-methyltransferase 1
MRALRAISLFTNCGAGDLGFARAGFEFSVLAELDPRRLEVALLNHPSATAITGDLRATWPLVCKTFKKLNGSRPLDLLAACPPCQGMSSARSDRGNGGDPEAGARDERNLLVLPIVNVARELRPRVIVVENVPAFLTKQVWHPVENRPLSAARLLIDALIHDYEPFALSADLADYGVPQTRRRCFLTLVRRDESGMSLLLKMGLSPFPTPTHGQGRRSHIALEPFLIASSLKKLDASSSSKARDPRHRLHQVPVWNRRVYKMVARIRARSGNSAWQNEHCEECGKVPVTELDAICPKCKGPLLRPVLKHGRSWRLVRGFVASSYRRMASDCPASTITTASGNVGSDSTIHPWENRVLSPYECALLQTFPRRFAWGDTLERHGVGFVRKVIGEAVPPRFTEKHGKVIARLLRGRVDRGFVVSSHTSCARAELALLPEFRALR